eukprot:2332819-Rhodomonas_salina.5
MFLYRHCCVVPGFSKSRVFPDLDHAGITLRFDWYPGTRLQGTRVPCTSLTGYRVRSKCVAITTGARKGFVRFGCYDAMNLPTTSTSIRRRRIQRDGTSTHKTKLFCRSTRSQLWFPRPKFRSKIRLVPRNQKSKTCKSLPAFQSLEM